MRPILPICIYLATLAGCATAEVQPLGAQPTTYQIRIIQEGFVSSPGLLEKTFTDEADRLCTKGFARVSERGFDADIAAGHSGGRIYVIRCLE